LVRPEDRQADSAAERAHARALPAFSYDGTEVLGFDGEFLFRWSANDARPLDQRIEGETLLASDEGQRLVREQGAAAVKKVVKAGVSATGLAENRFMELSLDGSHLLVTTIGGSSPNVVVDLRNGGTFEAPPAPSYALSPNGTQLVVFGEPTQIVRTDTGEPLRTVELPAGSRIKTGQSSPDAKQMVLADEGGRAWWLPLAPGGVPRELSTEKKQMSTSRFAPDGRRFALGFEDGSVELRSSEEPTRVLRALNGHYDRVWAIRFSPDGKRLVTTSADGTGLVWKLP